MVDPRMAQATAVHTKIATIAIIRFNMVVCAPTLSAATPTYLTRLALSSTFRYKVKDVRGSALLHVGARYIVPTLRFSWLCMCSAVPLGSIFVFSVICVFRIPNRLWGRPHLLQHPADGMYNPFN